MNPLRSRPLIGQVIAAGLAVAVMLVATVLLLLGAISSLKDSTNEQARSRDITAATLELERVVNELELSLRAYVESGNNHFLTSWRQGSAALPATIAGVQRLVAAQPAERNAVRRFSKLVHSYVSDYGTPVIAIRRISPAAARAPVVTREGLFRIDAIRSKLAGLIASEDTLAATRSYSARRDAGRAATVGFAALGIAAALFVLFGMFLARGIVRPVRLLAAGASRIATGDLSTRLPEQGAAEVRQLQRAFNAMARSLEQGTRELEIQNEQLRQSERLKSELVSVVSHELRTPLASILGYSSLLLKRDFDNAERNRYLEIIQTQTIRLATLAEEFLDAEQVETGRIALRSEPLDLQPLLIGEAELISDTTTQHQIEVVIDAETLPVRGDRDRLAQVFSNLLANAVKYSPEGGPIRIVGRINGDTVRVQIEDHGIGIPESEQAQIFTKFFRGGARQSGIAGTGLGLAVSREIVEAHGGRIGFTSTPRAGSTFWFELPTWAS